MIRKLKLVFCGIKYELLFSEDQEEEEMEEDVSDLTDFNLENLKK